MVLVDTPIWSLAFRRSSSPPSSHRTILTELIQRHAAILMGPIRQEILSGIKDRGQFEKLKKSLSAFTDSEIQTSDYETAARFFNLCRARGIQGSNTDFLICAVAHRNGFEIFTTDKDFERYASVVDVKILPLP